MFNSCFIRRDACLTNGEPSLKTVKSVERIPKVSSLTVVIVISEFIISAVENQLQFIPLHVSILGRSQLFDLVFVLIGYAIDHV